MARKVLKRIYDKIGKWGTLLLLLLFLAMLIGLAAISWVYRDRIGTSGTYEVASASEVAFGRYGHVLVVDNSKKTILKISEEGEVLETYSGDGRLFDYAACVTEGADGSLYVADFIYGSHGNLIDRERILRITDMNHSEVLWEQSYEDTDPSLIPMQYGNILELKDQSGKLTMVMRSGQTVSRIVLSEEDGTVLSNDTYDIGNTISDASYDPTSGHLIAGTRSGQLFSVDVLSGTVEELEVEGLIAPWSIVASDGEIYFTDLMTKSIQCIPSADAADWTEVFTDDVLLYNMSKSGSHVLVTDFAGYYDADLATGDYSYVDSLPLSYFGKVMALRVALIVCALILLFLLLAVLEWLLYVAIKQERVLRVTLVVIVSAIIAVFIGNSLLTQVKDQEISDIEQEILLFADTLRDVVDTEALEQLMSVKDYGSEAFHAVKDPLDEEIRKSYDSEFYYYYVIYTGDGVNMNYIMDYEDTQFCNAPIFDYGDNEYTQTFVDGEVRVSTELSSYGSWSFILEPIRNSSGEIIAILEVGKSLDIITEYIDNMARNLVINAGICVIVITMLVLEMLFLFGFVENRVEASENGGLLRTVRGDRVVEEALDFTQKIPIRTLVFFSYVSDSMQDAFIVLLCTQLYQGNLPINHGAAVALPMSAQLLSMAVFSFFGGKITERGGVRSSIFVGFAVQLAGFLTCLLSGSYMGLLVGKVMVGAGMGIIYVGCNTAASLGGSEEHSENAFASVSAGTLSGITIGAGLSSIILAHGDYHLIYLVGSIILALGLLLTVSTVPRHKEEPKVVQKEEEGTGKMSMFRFLFSRRILGFFVFLLVPFMMALSYREYLFPLFATEHGITEVEIGQLYLICGVVVLYIGPKLSSWIVRTFGSRLAVTAASILMVLNMLLFVIWPTLPVVILGVVILSFIISFAYTVQYTYFDGLEEGKQYGSGKAMGIYSVMESVGQTLGPIVYGLFLSFGYREGIFNFMLIMGLFVAVFWMLSIRRKDEKKVEEAA
ncbi:MAG: MFS transporter [Lachnospiraceae bacterium]|nr:MFS transporter [Lachnospiraceae bacterium]